MAQTIAPIAALLLSVAFLLTGNALQGTLLVVRGEMEAFSTLSIGLLGSTYFLGFGVGCLLGSHLVRRVGHIRTFAAMAAIASATPLVHGLWLQPLPWWGLRAITGFCFAVLYIVIESWLNERSTNETRGRVLSVYLVINLTVMTLGQLMMNLEDPARFTLFALTSILVSIAAVPVALTAAVAPAPLRSTQLRLPWLYRVSPVGVVGCLGVGLANGAFWTLAPLFAQRTGMDVAGIALFMSAHIVGGAIGQLPLGQLSDRLDRRWALAGGCAAAAACGLVVWLWGLFAGGYPQWMLLTLAFLWGAFAFPLYAIAIAHANDYAAADEFVEVSSGMLLVYAAGSVAGPLIAAGIMGSLGAPALYAFTALVHLLLGGFTAWRTRLRAAPPPTEQVAFTDALAAAQTISETFDAEIQHEQVLQAAEEVSATPSAEATKSAD